MLKYFRYSLTFFAAIFLTNCSSSVDTSKFSVDDYFNYAMKLYNDEDYELAIQEFQNFLLQYSGSSFNDDAQFYYAMTYFKRGQYLLAAYEFSKLIRNIPASPFVPEAQFMLAESYYKLAPPYQLDQAYTKKSIEEFQVFIDFFPADKRAEEAERKIKELTERLAEKEYQSGLIYEKMEYEKAAIKYYAFVADTYHDTKFAPLSLYKKIQLEVKKGMKTEAIADINTFLNRYPENEYKNEIKKIESQIVETK